MLNCYQVQAEAEADARNLQCDAIAAFAIPDGTVKDAAVASLRDRASMSSPNAGAKVGPAWMRLHAGQLARLDLCSGAATIYFG